MVHHIQNKQLRISTILGQIIGASVMVLSSRGETIGILVWRGELLPLWSYGRKVRNTNNFKATLQELFVAMLLYHRCDSRLVLDRSEWSRARWVIMLQMTLQPAN